MGWYSRQKVEQEWEGGIFAERNLEKEHISHILGYSFCSKATVWCPPVLSHPERLEVSFRVKIIFQAENQDLDLSLLCLW
jgi:hypothetical protein